jgi:hypothetical protein
MNPLHVYPEGAIVSVHGIQCAATDEAEVAKVAVVGEEAADVLGRFDWQGIEWIRAGTSTWSY